MRDGGGMRRMPMRAPSQIDGVAMSDRLSPTGSRLPSRRPFGKMARLPRRGRAQIPEVNGSFA